MTTFTASTARLAAAVLIFASCIAVDAAAQTERPPSPPASTAEAARPDLAARAASAKLKGLRGPARTAALETAAKAWEAAATAAGDRDRTSAAKAWFEAGELWRKHGSSKPAESCYAKALDADDGRYRARCRFQLGQVCRRAQRWDDALGHYRDVVEVEPATSRAHAARIWIGRVLMAKGEADAGIAALRSAYDATAHPTRSIDAANHLAKALVDRGDLDGAAAAITAVEGRVAPVIEKGGKDGPRVKRALERMSARKALRRARDARDGAVEDAIDVEAARRKGGGRS